MRNYPNISTGLGKFTPDLFSRLMKMLRAFESNPELFKILDQRGKLMKGRRVFIGKITHTGTISTNRFTYTVTEQELADFTSGSPDYLFTDKSNGITDMVAVNTVEVANTSSFAGPGVDLSAVDFPSGMSLQAVATGTMAICNIQRDENGEQVALFTIANAIDGSCS
jgi:hypothetical protein